MLGKRTKILTITLLTLLSTLSLRAIETKYTATIKQGDTYLFGCTPYTDAATPSKTLTAFGGGDSIVHLTLKMLVPAVKVGYPATINAGETYLFGCKQYTTSGEYKDTLISAAGGDSIVVLTLSVTPVIPEVKVGYAATINAGETYLFGCKQYTASGEYKDTLISAAGGDSIVVLTLSVTPVIPEVKVEYSTSIEVEDRYLLGCRTYQFFDAGPQTLMDTLTSAAGGDSIVIVHLTVTGSGGGDPIRVAYTATINDGETYLFGCEKLTLAGEYKDTLLRTNGSDSIITLTLNVTPVIPEVKVGYAATINAGQKYLFGCKTYTTAGQYTDTLISAAGGDSIVVLTLNVNADTAVAYTAKIKQGQIYLFGCTQYTTEGVYKDTLTRALGGDSIIQLTLNVLMPTYCDTTIVTCDSLEWIHGTLKVSDTYFDTIPNVAGGDSIVTLHLTINMSGVGEETLTACDSIEWKGTKYYASGDYTFDTLTVLGCDSVITLHLTINKSGVGEETLTACDSIEWKGTKYYTSGDYSFDTLTVHGCDSLIVLHLTVNYSGVGEETLTTCDSIEWKGKWYYTSGDYTFDTLTVAGCDSVITLHLTVYYSDATTETAVENCNSYYWAAADTTITKSGNYKHVFKTIHGCDSVVTLPVTIHYSDTTTKPTPTEPVCNQYYWSEADTMITKSGTYTHVFQNQYGCDSVVTFTVTIDVPYVDTLEVRAYYGYRIIMINRKQINGIPGWHLDSLDTDHPEYITWHQIDLSGKDTKVATGYYYSLPNGDPLPAGYKYYAIVSIPAAPGVPCGAFGRTETITIGAAAPAPALVPSLARPGEDIQVINLDPEVETTIRVYSTEGMLQKVLTSKGDTFCTIKAADANGFYLVEIITDDMKSTLRYMVK